MEVVVMGAGITGVTAAYVLASRGHKVTVLEQEKAPALQTSFSNGAQLSYSHAQPWANPAVFSKLLGWMFRSDAPLVLRPRAEWRMIKWSLMFLANCSEDRSKENCERMWRISSYSRTKMAQIRAETGVEFDFLPNGILHVFSDRKSYEGAIKQAEYQETLGCKEHIFSHAQCVEKEPALAHAKKDIIGGIYSDTDESGDIHLFTTRLADYCTEHLGVQFFYGASVLSIAQEKGGRVTSVKTTQGQFSGDVYVLALGSYSPILAEPLGVKLPIYPMKGYSITVPAWEDAPFVSITDDEKKVVFSRLGDKMRAAGTAEFAGYNTEVRAARIQQIMSSLTDLFPHASVDDVQKWACIRPQTPDGPPIIGRTEIDNLYLNTGHGTLGWTQGAGSAYLLADIMEGKEPEIRAGGLELSRYRK